VINQTRSSVLSGRIAFGVIIIVITLCWPARRVLAGTADGQLDPTFGSGGKVRSSVGLAFDIVGAVAIQEDGKIVVVGSSSNSVTGFDFAVARYTVDGKFDTSFGSGGTVTRDFQRSDDRAVAVAIQGDGKIVLAGTVNVPGPNTHSDFAVIRVHADGRLDQTFGVEGWAMADLGSNFFERATSVVLQRDEKIVVGGETFVSRFETDFGLVRFNANGSIDRSFGVDGIVKQNFGPDTSATVRGLAVQRDDNGVIAGDKIIAVGYAGNPGLNRPLDFALVRYNPDGSLDPTFGSGGLVTTDIGGGHDLVNAVALQPDGKIVVAGGSSKLNEVPTAFALARYNTDGALDPHFGSGGIVTTSFPASLEPDTTSDGDVLAEAFALAIRDGKIVAFGDRIVDGRPAPSGIDFIGARYLIDGSLDTSFGTGGLVMTDFTENARLPSDDFGVGVAIQKDDKIVGVGSLVAGDGSGSDFGLVRYLASRAPGTF
jgi:uncharacterized delta-60 repeat protein